MRLLNYMDYKTTIERILAIEKAMDVTSIRYKGLHLWPFVRMQLWQRLLHPNKYAPPAAIGLQRLAHKLSQGFFKPDFYTPYLEHAKRHKSNLAQLAEYGPTDILLYSTEGDHIDCFGGRYYNHHIDPLIDLIKTKYSFLKLELITDKTEQSLPRFEYTHFFDSLDYLRCDAQRSVIAAFQKTEHMAAIENGKTLTKILAGTRFDLALTEEYLMMESERILHYVRYFKEMLAAVNPKAVFVVNYHNNIGMALMTACKTLGITTVDIQRSHISQHHGMYSHWIHMPEQGFEMLPDVFWCWGKSTMEDMSSSRSEGRHHQRVLIGGNPWLQKWLEHEPAGYMSDAGAYTFIEQVKRFSKVVLVTLQESDRTIPSSVLEAIQKSPGEWFWLIRFHPKQRQRTEAAVNILQELHITNADINQATSLPLYFLMRNCHRHLTPWSSVAVEALRFNVPSVIVHPTGEALYRDYIHKGYFSYAEHAEAIISALFDPVNSLVEDPPYVETNRMYSIVALTEIMGRATIRKPEILESVPA